MRFLLAYIMAYPQNKHKQVTMDFFDKMQEKMQAEDSKRRKLSKQSTTSQPELLFLQFKQDHGEQCSGSTPHYIMSQQTHSKKTWKPPTKLCPNGPSIMDVGRKSNDENQFGLSPTLVKYPREIIKTYNSGNNNENYHSHQEGGQFSSVMSTIQELKNKVDREKTESDDSKLKAQITKVAVNDLDVCRGEIKLTFESSHSTMNESDDLKLSSLLSEKSSGHNEWLSDQENIATQQNPNLSNELDSSNSETGSQVQNSGRKSYENQNKEISDNLDIQLINSIDLILSENQLSQQNQSENYIGNNTSQKDTNSTVVESQRSANDMSGEFLKIIEINNEIAPNLTASSEINLEREQLRLEIDDNNEIVSNTVRENENKSNLRNDNSNDDNEISEINWTKDRVSSVRYSENIQQSDGLQTHPDSSNCIESQEKNQEKNNDAPSESIESYIPIQMNVSKIIQKSIKQAKIDSFCRSEEHGSVDRHVGEESSQPDEYQRADKKQCEKGANKIVVVKHDKEHGSVALKEVEKEGTLQEIVNYEENKPAKLANGGKENFDGLVVYEENRIEDREVKGVNKITFDPSNQIQDDQVNTPVAPDKDTDENERNKTFQPELCDEDKNGFDDDYSCLMISNSQLMELERKYYERPENSKPPVNTNTTHPKICINHNTRSIGVQTECGIIGMLSSNPNSMSLPLTTSSTVQWTKQNQEIQRQLRDTIQEIGRLNAILLRIRKELWPQRNVTETNKF